MRSFVISVIIFIILIILVTVNSIYIHSICDKMLSISHSITQNDINGAEKLCNIWKKNQMLFGISIHDSHIEKITELTENIKSAVILNNGAEFKKNIILLNELLDELKKNEEISFEGII